MDKEELETFLCVCEYHSLIKTSEILYISQATASNRIASLENKLGYMLINRGKGQRTVTVTEKGKAFIPFAKKMLSLWDRAKEIKNEVIREELSISSSYTNNAYIFFHTFHDFTFHHPELKLSFTTYHSHEIHKMLDDYSCDIGFCSNNYTEFSSLFSFPFYKQKMGIAISKNHPFVSSHDISLLDSRKEVYEPYSKAFELWHKEMFHNQCFVTTSTFTMQIHFLESNDLWAIIPDDFVSLLPEDYTFIVMEELKIPDRITYFIYNRHTSTAKKKAIQLFLNEMLLYYHDNPHLISPEITIK